MEDNLYPRIMVHKDLCKVVHFEREGVGYVVDNIKGNIKGYRSFEWDMNDFVAIEEVLEVLRGIADGV